jgi:O-antigen ligase
MPAHAVAGSRDTARWAATALGFSIPFTIALNNLLLAVTLVAWLLSRQLPARFSGFRHPVARVTLLIFVLLLLATLYGTVHSAAASVQLRKYADLLFVPMFLALFLDAQWRTRALQALALSLVAILVVSCLVRLGLPVPLPSFQGHSDYPVIFKERITHNILMAFAVYLFAWLALSASVQRTRWLWATAAVLAFFNVMVMVPGATGYVILAALLLFLGYRRLGWRGLGTAAAALSLSVTALVALPNPFQHRVNQIVGEVQAWRIDQPAQSSPALRLEFYRTTLSIIADHPFVGVGTGGFAAAYAEKVKDTGRTPTQNPHNEFLLMWAQLGIAGLAALLWLFFWQWRLASRLPTRLERELAYGLVITMVIGCMLNSLLLDHTEGLFYAWLTGVLYGGLKSGCKMTENAEKHRREKAVDE